MEWDLAYNNSNPWGYYTIYTSDYDGDFTQTRKSFNFNNIELTVSIIKAKIARNAKKSEGDEDQEEYRLVGLNSNSFTTNQRFHNIFLEWDHEHEVPDMNVLKTLGGMIVETDGGIHLIKEDNIEMPELISMMKRLNCCPGFTNWSERRGMPPCGLVQRETTD